MIRSIHTQIIVLDMCATNARYLRTEIPCQPSSRFNLVIALRCSVVHIQNFAIKISASETGAESLQITYHLFRGARHHESRMDRATGNWRGVGHENGRAGNKIITSFPHHRGGRTSPLKPVKIEISSADHGDHHNPSPKHKPVRSLFPSKVCKYGEEHNLKDDRTDGERDSRHARISAPHHRAFRLRPRRNM